MATDFKYASQSDLKNYFNRFGDFDQKVQIFPTETSGNNHFFRDSGYVDTLFVNGSEQAVAQDNFDLVNSDGKWCYNSSTNDVKYQNSAYSSTTIHEQVFESGVDFSDFIDQQLVNASMELNNLLDRRYPTPIPKYAQHDQDTTYSSSATEYDAIIIKSTCFIAASNLIRSKEGVSEEADMYYSQVTNMEGTGLIDRLNKGEYKLAFEVDAKDSKGKIRTIAKTGSMDIIETAGAYIGEAFDVLRVTCTTAGGYGTATVKVEYYGNDQLYGSETSDIIVTGGLQELHSGLYVRFQGASMNLATTPDKWEIEVYSDNRKNTNISACGIQLIRGGYGI